MGNKGEGNEFLNCFSKDNITQLFTHIEFNTCPNEKALKVSSDI